jgi:hypothetical protein
MCDNALKKARTPALQGSQLHPAAEEEEVSAEEAAIYYTIVGKLLYLIMWSRPEMGNAVREASRRVKASTKKHMKYLNRIVSYVIQTPNRDWFLKPTRKWDAKDRKFEFKLRGRSDSNYGTDTETRRSVSGFVVYMEDAPVVIKSNMQKIVTLSSTEAELIAMVSCIQEMMSVKKLLESLELKVELPMVVECDNKGAVDLVNGYQVGGGTKHIDIRNYFVRELKDNGIIKVKWISTDKNEADILTKNTRDMVYDSHIHAFVGIDEYMDMDIN